LTFAARTRVIEDEAARRWRRKDMFLSLGLAVGVLAIWLYFS
jgi:hypothetical protein